MASEAGFQDGWDAALLMRWQDPWIDGQDEWWQDGWAAESALQGAKDALFVDFLPSECWWLATRLASSCSIFDAVHWYLFAEAGCRALLPKARDVIVAHAAVAIGLNDRHAFLELCGKAFDRFGRRWEKDQKLRSAIQGSWHRTCASMQGAWRSKKSQARLLRDQLLRDAGLERGVPATVKAGEAAGPPLVAGVPAYVRMGLAVCEMESTAEENCEHL